LISGTNSAGGEGVLSFSNAVAEAQDPAAADPAGALPAITQCAPNVIPHHETFLEMEA
jgi:hypothetical protein